MNINLKNRLTNKGFWVALISAMVGITQLLGVKVFPDNWAEILNSILGILIIMGVIIDPTTPGINDTIAPVAPMPVYLVQPVDTTPVTNDNKEVLQ